MLLNGYGMKDKIPNPVVQGDVDSFQFHQEIEEEKAWEKTLKLADKEIAEIFFDIDLFESKVKELEEDCIKIKQEIKNKLIYLKKHAKNKEEANILRVFIIHSSVKELVETENQIKRLKRLKTVKEGYEIKNKNGVTKDEIERAKEKSLVSIASEFTKLRKCGKDFIGLCPLHQERTPSFHINEQVNIYHCFGACQKHGDVINFVMEKFNLPFIEAVRQLLRY